MNRFLVLLLAIAVLGGTGWAWVDYLDRVDTATDRKPSSAERTQEPAVAVSDEEPTVVFLGDSYVAGDGATDKAQDGWVALVSEELGWDARNFGFGGTGYVTAGPLPGGQPFGERVQALLAQSPDIVVVSGGRNDAGVASPSAVEEAALDLFKTLSGGASVIAVGPVYDYREYPRDLQEVAEAVERAADQAGVPFVPYKNPLIGMESLFPDGVHPTNEGYARIAESLAKPIDRAAP